ncbi:MAG: hypothetical protein KGD63_15855 [Candidatus Lokiarchaeota archaeon]|nr:hypothetical protein [Candidatus Lokiarchaeota archaeon]
MRLKVKKINFETGNMKDVVLNHNDAEKIGQKAGERVFIKNIDVKNISEKYWVAILRISHSDSIVAPGELGVFVDTLKDIKNLKENSEVSVLPAEAPTSYKNIQKKIRGFKLNSDEIHSIVNDAVSGKLSKIEIASFITGISINNMDNEEMTALTLSEGNSGGKFDFGPEVYDKHST